MMRKCLIFLLGSCPTLGVAAYPALAERATIVVVLEPQKHNSQKWDIGRGADPVLCLKRGCYVSRGLSKNAKYYRGGNIFLPGIRAGACRNSLACVFRNVQLLNGKDEAQLIDLDAIEHDFLDRRPIKVDESCHLRNKRIDCGNGIFS
ncbi:MAG: hypothetical protein ACR2OX_03280, partial [Methyloligellaceae bacterium]